MKPGKKLLCFVFEYKHGLGQISTGVCAYNLFEARQYFLEYLNYNGDLNKIPNIESMEPMIYDDTENMIPGW
jgi:hypothetical protein